jgi:acylphosphatase
MAETMTAAYVRVEGRVQGVGYRFFAHDAAEKLGLKGWVRNMEGGGVEAEVEGPRSIIENWIQELRRGPSLACVESLHVDWRAHLGQFKNFSIEG